MKRKKIDCPYQSKDITRDVISKFCEIKKIENLNLAVDRFDQMNGSSKYVQQIYNRYFGLFHKVILSSEDKDLNPKILPYRIKKVTYGMDKEVLKQIIKHREFFYKEQENYGDVFTQDWILERLTKLNGNIDLSLKVLNSAMKNLELGYQNLESILEKCIQEQQEYAKKLERISPKTTFYF